jgi:hypothetical protein
MSRAKARFTQTDVSRVLAAAKKLGVNVRIQIASDGTITVVTAPPSEAGNTSNPWDKVLESAAPKQKRAS